jgi:Ca2+-binding RTX toxin-like protein
VTGVLRCALPIYDAVHINDRGRAAHVDCGPGVDTVFLDPPGRPGHISDNQLRRRGGIRGCESFVYAPPPPRDPALGITWLGPIGGARKNGTSRNDTLLGSRGPDLIRGRGGDDVIWGNQLHKDRSRALDRLYGDSGRDTIYGGSGRNVISGGDGADYLQGGAGSNTIRGGWGDDTIRLRGRGPNTVSGGPGNDVVYAYSRRPARISCGPGLDVVEVDRHDRVSGDCERVRRH